MCIRDRYQRRVHGNTFTQNKKRMEAEINLSTKSHEEEVQLRLKFETKLNGIYSVYRDLQNRYERAISDVKDLLEFKHQLDCLLYTSPSPRDLSTSRMPSSA
eukprot:TRINITY_DN63157_c0_g1_i1.p4 TRINITY_DN63157_c0_g1~~TRINITY_DN63157_c0_g1_i1.p4  ORF type:complete len:102 (+),score=30.59 TRINITY_DN63157_c0_g1_i1:178-483(+)